MFSITLHYGDPKVTAYPLGDPWPDYTVRIFPEIIHKDNAVIFLNDKRALINFKNRVIWAVEDCLRRSDAS